jgi:hypothetical protein
VSFDHSDQFRTVTRRDVELVFRSEADFQHALAWESHQAWPQQLVRLETRPAKGIHLDVLLIDRLAGREVALELKYLTAPWQGVARQESFELLSHGTQDVRAYDCIKDVSRVEKFAYDRPGADGAVVVLTNDSNYWTPRTHGRMTNAHQVQLVVSDGVHPFRVHLSMWAKPGGIAYN